MPAHHNFEAYIDAYIKAADIGDAGNNDVPVSFVSKRSRPDLAQSVRERLTQAGAP